VEAPSPVIVAVDDDPSLLGALERELTDRYARSYRVVCAGSVDEANAELATVAASGEEAVLVLAPERLGDASGSEFLGSVRALHPLAQRGLLIEWRSWGDGETRKTLFRAMARRQIEDYVIRPSRTPDEVFHQAVTASLLEWANARRVSPNTVHVVANSWTGRASELRHVLGRCAIPHAFVLAESEQGSELVSASGEDARLPLVVLPNGAALEAPSDLELAAAVGATIDPERRDFDVVIIGAGPAGLSAAVYGASEGFRTLVVDEGGIGGQATSSSLIATTSASRAGSRDAGWPRARSSRPGCRRRVRLHAPTPSRSAGRTSACRSRPPRLRR
jgi:thioredoxin reductase (NADPH)